jgi:signal transduction histidine kinase
VVTNYTTEHGLLSNLTRCLAEDEHGDIWVSDWEGAICKYRGDGWEVIRKSSGHSDAVRAMVMEKGTIWVGTSAGGLLRYRNGKTDRLTIEQGLPDNSIRQLLFDGPDDIWGVTPHRLFRLSLERINAVLDGYEKRVEPVIYGRSDGLPDTSFASWCDPRCWRTQDGEIWLATANGAIHFKPAVLPERRIPRVVIEDILLDGKPASGEVLEKLRPGTHRLKFVFSAPCLTSPERVRFRYRLTGVDDDWVEAGPERSATYPTLPAGLHEFSVLASSPNGAWGSRTARAMVSVHPFFWQTKWFLALAVAVVAGSGALLIRRATVRRLKRRLDELHRQHAMERERARIARDIHDELGANLTSIGLLADIGRRHKLDPAAVSNDFNQISQTARESVIAMDAIVWAINPRNDSLDHFANYIAQFAREFFGPTQIRTRLGLPTDLPVVPLPAETRHQMFLLVKEAFNNVVRHARATEVHFDLACDDRALKLTIADNGIGFVGNTTSSGNGIPNMRERIERLGGTLLLTTAAAKGTRLEFTIPLLKPVLN